MQFEIFLALVLLTFSILAGCFILATSEFGNLLFHGLNLRLQAIWMRISMEGIPSKSANEVSGAEEANKTDKTKKQKRAVEPPDPLTTSERERSPVEGNCKENRDQATGCRDQGSNDIPT